MTRPAVGRYRVAEPVLGHADGLAAQGDAAGVGRLQHVDAAQEGALAGAAGAEHGDPVAFAGGDRDALQDLELSEALVDVFADESRLCGRYRRGRLSH